MSVEEVLRTNFWFVKSMGKSVKDDVEFNRWGCYFGHQKRVRRSGVDVTVNVPEGKAHDRGSGIAEFERLKRVAKMMNDKGLRPQGAQCRADFKDGKPPKGWGEPKKKKGKRK